MSSTLSPTTGKPYGVARVCRIWRMGRASVYRHRHPEPSLGSGRDPQVRCRTRPWSSRSISEHCCHGWLVG
jgi:hypothetical protein